MTESFLNIDFNDVYEPKSMKEGEYQVRILSAVIKSSQKTGGDYLNVRLEIMNEPEAKDINHVMMLPAPNDDKKKANSRKAAILAFLKAFKLDTSGSINPDDMVGAVGWAIAVEEADPEYGMQNRIRKFVAGQ